MIQKIGLIAAVSAIVSFSYSIVFDYYKEKNSISSDRIYKFEESYLDLAKEISLINFIVKIPSEKSNEIKESLVKQISSVSFLAGDLKNFLCKSDEKLIDDMSSALLKYRNSLQEIFAKNDASLGRDAAFELTRSRHFLIQGTIKYRKWPFYRCWLPIIGD